MTNSFHLIDSTTGRVCQQDDGMRLGGLAHIVASARICYPELVVAAAHE
jgi:hypothetical protein